MDQRVPITDVVDLVKKNWTEASAPEADIVMAFLRMNELIRQETDYILKMHNLTAGSFEVLCALRIADDSQALTPTDLHRSVLVTSGGMTKILSSLEREGLIERLANPDDKRSSFIKLSQAGKSKAELVMSEVLELDQTYFENAMSKPEIKKLRTALLDSVSKVEATFRPRSYKMRGRIG